MLKKISILTLFPEVISQALRYSLLGKALFDQNRSIEVNIVSIREFATDKHKSVDDTVYGGGAGMLMRPDVLFRAWSSIIDRPNFDSQDASDGFDSLEAIREFQKQDFENRPKTVLLSPQGQCFQQTTAKNCVNQCSHLVLVCGHYEGVDDRFIQACVDEEWSIGDYVLTGGEYPALVITDVLVRLIPNTVGNIGSIETDSLEGGLLKYPQYTRPRDFLGLTPPDILLSGNHAVIENWRKSQSIQTTARKRPDLFRKTEDPKGS